MKTLKLAETGFHQCDNCEEIHHGSELHDIKDFEQRIDPGDTVPSGECPDCGCLCYPVGSHDVQVEERRLI